MKLSIAALAVGAGVAMAQSLSDLPPCGQTCVNNMINIASSEFGCKLGDINCYCTNANFGYGIRDCSNESCSKDDAAKVISFGTAYCQNQVSGGVSASGSATPTGGSAASILSSAAATATGASGSEVSAASTAITTVPLVATAVSDGKTVLQTTGFSTVYSSVSGAAGSLTGSAASALSSATESANSAISSALSSASSVAASASSKAASAASSAAGAASSAASKATGSGSASSTGAAPKMTALPLAGAAGMAALFFL